MEYPKPKKGLTYFVFCKNIVDNKSISWQGAFINQKTKGFALSNCHLGGLFVYGYKYDFKEGKYTIYAGSERYNL